MHDERSNPPEGFTARLFDASFARQVTPRILAALYFLLVVAAGIAALLIIAAGLTSGSLLLATAGLAFGPMVFCVIVFLARVGLEVAAAVLRIEKNVAYLARRASPED